MSEEQNNKDLPVAEKEKDEVETLPTEEKKVFSRRQALLGALFGAGAVLAKTAKAAEASCACLAPPDCSTVCEYGGNPKGDGTQACECNTAPVQTQTEVTLDDIVTAGTVGPTADVTMKRNITETYVTKISKYSSNKTYATYYALTDLDHPIGSFVVPYFTVDSKGRITSYGSRTISIVNNFTKTTRTDYYNYYNYSDYSDGNCFISGKLLTTEGSKPVNGICVGDVLIGEDGEHKVLGIVTGTLGANRFAQHPVNDPGFILTADHVIYEHGEFVIVSKKYFKPNRNLMQSPTVKGTYDYEGLFEKCVEKPESFVKDSRFAPETKTYSFIVDKGMFGKTEGGTNVLLAHVVNSKQSN